MKMNAIVNRVVVEARATGFDQTTASVKQLDNAVDGLRVANDRTAKSTLDVTPALDRLRRSMDAEYRAAQQLAAGQRTLTLAHQTGLISAVQQERIFAQLQARYGTAGAAAGRLAAANDNLARSSSATAASATGLTTAIAGLAGIAATAAAALAVYGVAILAIGTSAAQTGIQMQALERSFAAAAGSALQGGREFTFVKAESERLGLAFGETAKQYAQLVAASRDSTLQGQATRDIFIAVSQAMTALGKSSDETGGALLAIQQMMSKGTVSAEEIRQQLGERLPGAFNLAAAAMGKTTAEFGKMLEDGDVLATELIPKLSVELNKFYRASAAAASNDLGANINRLKNAWQEYQAAVAGGGLNDSLNRAAQALTTFLRDSDSGASTGRRLGDAINAIVTALERVPRGAENFGILAQMAREALSAFGAWIESFTALQGVAVETGASVGDSFSAVVGYVQTAINGVIGVAVAGYQMVGVAWQGLPGVFAQIAKQAGDALIAGIESAVNFIINGLNAFIGKINSIGKMLPEAMGFKELETFKPVVFERITTEADAATGAAGRLAKEMSRVGKETMDTNYLGEFGKSVEAAVDGQISRFRELRSAQDASNHLLREADKIAKESKVADAYKNAAAAGKAAKEAAEESGGAAGKAASAYDNLIQRTKDRIEELQLEAQYASKTATEVIKLKLAHDLERAAKKDGTEVTEAMRKEWDELGGELADAIQNLERVRKAQNDLKKAQDAVADSFKSFVEDVLTGSDGINGALKSLGKTFLSNSLDALISGKGPLAGITGLASSTKDGQGGILGLLSGNLKPFSDAVAKGTAKGSAEGFETGWHRAAANDNSSFFRNINSKDLAGGLTAIAGLAGSYGSGMAAGSYAQAGIGGALSGGMAGLSLAGTSIGASLGGAAVLGPIGLVAGAGLAIFGQQQAQKQAKKEQRRQALEAYREAQPQIAQLGSQFRGDPQGTIAQRIAEAETAWRKLGDVAVVAGRPDDAVKLHADFVTYRERLLGEFRASFDGMIDAFRDGTGPNSPFAAARDSVKSLGDQLKVFVDDAKTVFGADAPQVQQAREAAASYALTVLNGAKNLTMVETRFQEIQGTAAGLAKVLTDLGWSAEAAADAVSKGATAALNRLKGAFETDLRDKILANRDKSYITETRKLIEEYATLQRDAAAVGTDMALVEQYFREGAQAIVDNAQLTGDGFQELLRWFPQLGGIVTQFVETLDAAAAKAALAARRLGYQDRLFGALNDTSTLEGQLAAYDRLAMREREEEIKAGGEAILDLENAQMAERFNIIKEFNQQAIDAQKRALDEAKNYIDRFRRTITEYLDGLRAGSDSPLSPQARLAAAQSQYNAQLGLAQGGNRDALDGITSYASDLLDAAKGFYASSSGFQAIFAQIQSQLGALPGQISAEQFIVNAINDSKTALTDALALMRTTLNTSLQTSITTGSASAIATALSTYFNNLDSNTDGLLSQSEYLAGLNPLATKAEQTAAKTIFQSIDADGDGQLSRLELIRAATVSGTSATGGVKTATDEVKAAIGAQEALLNAIKLSTAASSSNIAAGNALSGDIRNLTAQLKPLAESTANTLTAANSANGNSWATAVHLENMRRMMQEQNRWWGVAGNGTTILGSYAQGGLIGGVGTGTSDSNLIRASRGEFMMSERATRFFGADMLASMNDDLAMPSVPVPMMGGGDMRAVVAELKALRAELAAHKVATVRATVAAAEHVGDEVKVVAAVQSDTAREMRNRAA